MDIKDLLMKLSHSTGVSGAEGKCGSDAAQYPTTAELALEMLREYIPTATKDKFGNVYGVIEKDETYPTILLDAHIDEIGMIVSYIEEDGFLRVGLCGGVDRRMLPAQAVTVWGKKPLRGIIATLPPHVAKDEDKAIKTEKIAIDVGYPKEAIEELVSLGDKVTVDVNFAQLKNGRVTGKALDDRAGVVSILYALELLKDTDVKCNIAVLFSAQEEVGCRGAKVGAYRLKPDYSIAVDVSYGVCPDLTEREAGHLGKGAMIGISPCLDRDMFEGLVDVAKEESIDHQIEVMEGTTGTNADSIAVTRAGVTCGLLSIPLRNMHTSVEVVQLSDIEAVGKLIAAYLKKGIV